MRRSDRKPVVIVGDEKTAEAVKQVLAAQEHYETDPRLLFVGDRVGYTRGPELLAPIRYWNVVVGPVSGETTVRDGEHIDEAFARLKKWVDDEFERQVTQMVADHLRHVRIATEMAETQSKGR